VFTDLTAATGGVCCLLDTETDIFDICWLNGETVSGETRPRGRSWTITAAAWRRLSTVLPPRWLSGRGFQMLGAGWRNWSRTVRA
jgi:hypothetical protein